MKTDTQELQILSLNAFGDRSAAGLAPDVAALVERRRRSFGAGSVLFYDEPLKMVRAEGAYLYASDGRAYLDFYNNVPTVGHCHPKVVEAVRCIARTRIKIPVLRLCGRSKTWERYRPGYWNQHAGQYYARCKYSTGRSSHPSC